MREITLRKTFERKSGCVRRANKEVMNLYRGKHGRVVKAKKLRRLEHQEEDPKQELKIIRWKIEENCMCNKRSDDV